MTTSQTTLTDTDDTNDSPDRSTTPDDSPTTDRENPSNTNQTTLAPPNQRGGQGCCPWCLAAAETFEHHDDGRIGCGYCDAAIPVGAEWFKRGEKIVV